MGADRSAASVMEYLSQEAYASADGGATRSAATARRPSARWPRSAASDSRPQDHQSLSGHAPILPRERGAEGVVQPLVAEGESRARQPLRHGLRAGQEKRVGHFAEKES